MTSSQKSQVVPYGSWKSPITADLIVAGSIRLGEVRLDGETVYWSEGRPTEAGRSAIVRRDPNGQTTGQTSGQTNGQTNGQTTDVTPMPFNVRTRVHEYGGGSYIVVNGTIYFSNFADQRLYRQSSDPTADQTPEPITPEQGYRYADAVSDEPRDRLICVREDHTGGGHEPSNALVALKTHPTDATTNAGEILASGHDFYASPRLSPDGSMLAWLTWDHPRMPWDGTELWVALVDDNGVLRDPLCVAGGDSESIFQPEWSPAGDLYFVSDRTGWWNLYRAVHQRMAADPWPVEPLCPKAAEFGQPQWVFGMTNYGFESAESLVCTYLENGVSHLARLNLKTLALQEIPVPFTSIGGIHVGEGFVVLGGGTPDKPGAIALVDLNSGAITELRCSSALSIDSRYISIPKAIEFPTENGLTAYGFFYPPQNADFVAPAGDRPPLLVKSHGGPTAATGASFSPSIQFWTSRGIAVLDVNYGGSTGYGREYRERLKGNWGIVDVDDCVNGARYLVEQGLVDGDRLCIDGGSAGGYTTLAALTFRNVFKAGASHYGVSDLEALARDTHKFESRYLDGLIGPYPAQKDLYEARSPIYAVSQLDCPLIFFQGDEDKIVPPNQAEMMVDALRQKKLPVAYVLFEGEQHGFRKAENIKRALEGELYFYSRIFGFDLADAIEPVAIENL